MISIKELPVLYLNLVHATVNHLIVYVVHYVCICKMYGCELEQRPGLLIENRLGQGETQNLEATSPDS